MSYFGFVATSARQQASEAQGALSPIRSETLSANEVQMFARSLIHRLLHEAQERWPIGADVPREEIIAWLDSRTTHWLANDKAKEA